MNGSKWMHEMTWEEIAAYRKSGGDVVLIPVGATEQHGRHMALSMDTCWATGMCEGTAERTNVLITPPVHYGWGPHHLAYPGTITLRSETLKQVCVDIGESLAYHGFSKLIFVNGNRIANLPAMQLAASYLRHKTGAFVAVADAGLIAKHAIRGVCDTEIGGLGHAGESETSYMLFREPTLVDMKKAELLKKSHGRFSTSAAAIEPPYDSETVFVPSIAQEFLALTKQAGGTAGNPTTATTKKGEKIHEIICDALAAFIREVVQPKEIKLKKVEIPA